MSREADKRMRVLLLPSWYPSDHNPLAGLFVQQQAVALASACDVAVLHVEKGGSSPRAELAVEGDITVVRAALPLIANPANRLEHLQTLWRITVGYQRAVLDAYEVLRKQWGCPDIVHVHASFPAAVGAAAIRRRTGLPYVITEHQAEFLLQSPGFVREGGRLLPTLVRRSMRAASAVIAPSTALAAALSRGGYYSQPEVIPNMVYNIVAPPSPREKHTGPPSIVHVSLMRSFEKNLPMLLEALKLLDSSGCDYRFVFAGDGPDRASIMDAADRMGLTDTKVSFLGQQSHEQVLALYGKADFSVVSSRYETFCLAAAESIAAGCPVVATRCGGPEDYIDDRVGILVRNEDSEALADGMRWMMEHSDNYDPAEMHRIATERFSPDSVVAQVLAVYTRVLSADE